MQYLILLFFTLVLSGPSQLKNEISLGWLRQKANNAYNCSFAELIAWSLSLLVAIIYRKVNLKFIPHNIYSLGMQGNMFARAKLWIDGPTALGNSTIVDKSPVAVCF